MVAAWTKWRRPQWKPLGNDLKLCVSVVVAVGLAARGMRTFCRNLQIVTDSDARDEHVESVHMPLQESALVLFQRLHCLVVRE
jgi:hypothetical protein